MALMDTTLFSFQTVLHTGHTARPRSMNLLMLSVWKEWPHSPVENERRKSAAADRDTAPMGRKKESSCADRWR